MKRRTERQSWRDRFAHVPTSLWGDAIDSARTGREEVLSNARLQRAFAEINTEIERTPYPKQPWHKLDGLLRSPILTSPIKQQSVRLDALKVILELWFLSSE